MDLSDEPMLSQIKPAPANIMILLDDSGSMALEVLALDYEEGRFPRPGEDESNGYGYIFDSPQNHAFQDKTEYMGETGRKMWKSQSHDYNLVYYNPAVKYHPWPGFGDQIFLPADMEFPRFHPFKKNSETLDLDGKSFSVALELQALPMGTLQVKHAHYFQEVKDGRIYLVVLDGDVNKVKYFEITEIEGKGMTEKVKKIKPVTAPPGEIRVKEYETARQNFANWFTYHRRREYVAKGVVARAIKDLEGVRVGILSINGSVIVPLKSIGVWREGIYYDATPELLKELYTYDSTGDAPLREGLHDVGEYYRGNSKRLTHHGGKSAEGDAPAYLPEADGGACQQSFTIVITDGYYDYEKGDLNVGNADGDDQSLYDGGPYADTLTETLADVAMYYYENDLSPDPEDTPAGEGLADRVCDPQRANKSLLDNAPHQHMVTVGVAFGVTGNFDLDSCQDEQGGVNCLETLQKENGKSGKYPNWPGNIQAKSKETIDDLYHATVNGRGRFLIATDPQALANALTEQIDTVLNRIGSSSATLVSRITEYGRVRDDIFLFQATYRTDDWSGDIKAYKINPDTGILLDDGPAWSAADSLDPIPWNQRNIFSHNGSYGIDFDENHLSDAQKKIIGPDYREIVQFIKGKNIAGYRSRSIKLGDVVHSSPIMEEGVIYVGANDGMLHAFEITTDHDGSLKGNEIFAYIPGFVFENLKELADPGYRHRYFVDLTPTVVNGNGIFGGDNLATILVGGMGKGGKGYFALDVTDPKSMTTDHVLWEFPNAADHEANNDTGYSFSKPLVVRTNSARKDESWVVIFGNGYDSAKGNAVLFILNPKTGEIIHKIIADNPSIESGNGLSSPIAVDVNADRKVDFVFAGDLKGNMWKFDLTADNSSQWTVAFNDGTYDQPLFKAAGPDGSKQPITSKPEVMLHPGGHGLMVLFGTGRLLGNSDFMNKSVQSVYGIWDYGDRVYNPGEWGDYSNDDNREYLGSFTRARLSNQPENVTLMEQTSSLHTIRITGADEYPGKAELRVMSSTQPVWNTRADRDAAGTPNFPDLADIGTSHAGWYYDLPLDGERIISDVLLRDGRLTVICFTPDRDRCSDGGSSFLMDLNAFTGGSIPAAVLDINEDGVIDTQDTVIMGYDSDRSPIEIPPAGINLPGNLQPPATLKLNRRVEVNYLSSSIASVQSLKKQAERVGVIYWKELER